MEYAAIEVIIIMLALAGGCWFYVRERERRLLKRLENMLEKARKGQPCRETIDETMVSSVENSMARFLEDNMVAEKNLSRQKERIQTMISDISHQTAIPLSNILIYSQLLEEECREPGMREKAEVIRQQGEKLEFLLDSLVKVSRLENGIIQTVPTLQDVGELVKKAGAFVSQKAQEKKIALEVKTGDGISAWYDEKWTGEAICNLADNAVKYTPPGGRVTLEVIPYNMFCRINVEDRGIGIREEDLPEIFHRFYRSRDVLSEEGVGLGLYLAREIIKSQGGYIKVSSKVGGGSVFSVFLPMEERRNVSRL